MASHANSPQDLAQQFLNQTTMRDLLQIPDEALDHVMATAYQLYQVGRHQEVEILCKGLIAADHKYWWSYSLYAAALRRLGRLEEALQQLDRGLIFEPGESKLLLMRGEVLAALGRWIEAKADLTPVVVTGRPADQLSASRTLTQLST
jgi:tetratricopeptide (TPR) repeat protein